MLYQLSYARINRNPNCQGLTGVFYNLVALLCTPHDSLIPAGLWLHFVVLRELALHTATALRIAWAYLHVHSGLHPAKHWRAGRPWHPANGKWDARAARGTRQATSGSWR